MISLIKKLPNIYYQTVSKRGVTYVKSFDENKWVPEKKYAVKLNTRTIGKINSGNGAGLIMFEESFLKSRPEYRDVAIVRYYDEETKKWDLRIEEDHSSEIITSLKENSKHEVTDVISVGTYLLSQSLLKKILSLNHLRVYSLTLINNYFLLHITVLMNVTSRATVMPFMLKSTNYHTRYL